MTKSVFIANHGNTTPTNLYLEIARGKIPGVSTGSILSFNPDVDIASEETIWAQGGIYTYLTANTELFISSSSASDTNVGLLIEGMTDDFVFKTIPFTFTDGQSQQSIGDFFRILKITVISGSVPVGDVYCAEADTLTAGVPNTASKIKAKMVIGSNITQLGLFTVPANHTFYAVRLNTFTRKNKDSVVKVIVRPDGFPGFIQTAQFPTFQNSILARFEPTFVINQKTDLELRAVTETNQTEVVANVGYILIDNNIV